jgi:geranylgeranyl pyrophosphate synthase
MQTLLKGGLSAVDEQLLTVTGSDVAVLHDASAHTIVAGGKRLRPRLALLAYLAAGGEDLAQVVPAAAALELVHTATLVHDDINDHSLTRRGAATVHARWGRTFALLTGDYLFAKVYEMMAPYGAEINQIMATACVRLVEGETLQAQAAKSGQMDRATYKRIIALKTASLFEAGAQMGALLAGASPETVSALKRYGYNLGLTFQIVDDVLDIVGDAQTMGKPTGVDVLQGHGAVMAQNGRAAAAVATATATVTATATATDPLTALMSRLRESGAIETAREQARETAGRAREALAELEVSPARDMLAELITVVLERDQ